ncbi:MAG: TldD/PmbA family protein [Candidatus Bathyarchaeia archaeon]
MREFLSELGGSALREAERLGATQTEVYLQFINKLEIKIERGAVRAASKSQDAGCGIRSVIGKRTGYSFITAISRDGVFQTVHDSISAARSSVPDEHFVALPSYSGSYPTIKDLYDEHVADLTAGEAAELMMRGVSACREVSGLEKNLIRGLISATSFTTVMVNSLGLNCHSQSTEIMLDLTAVIGEGDQQCSSWEEMTSCRLQHIEPEVIGRTAAESALSLRGARTIQGGDMQLVLVPQAIQQLLGGGLVPAVNAREVQDGKSYLVDSLGSTIAPSFVDIVDDALVEGGVGSRSFDGEGSPSKRTAIVDSGVLTSYLHDSYSSSRAQVENTSNASRSSYQHLPVISQSNLTLNPGHGSRDDLVQEIDEGVLCRLTLDEPNMVTGELSAMVMEGFYIRRGEIQHALKNTLFGTTMHSLLKNISTVGSDVERRGSVITPSVVVDSVKITSG